MSDYLPLEIVMKILLKLPVESLIRATSVCKAWLCLIRSPSFISDHLSSNTSRNQVFPLGRYDMYERVFPKGGPLDVNTWSKLKFYFKDRVLHPKTVGSCDGLLCVSADFIQPIIIWNPAIRNHVVLPVSPIRDPEESLFIVLGFGVANNAYKVVRLVHSNILSYLTQADVFSLGAGTTWRMLDIFDLKVRLREYSSTFFKGFMHWIGYEQMNDRRECNLILTFHVGEEVFGKTRLPEELERSDAGTSFSLGIMQQQSLAATSFQRGKQRCEVWMLKAYGVKESWTRLYRIDSVGFDRVIGIWGSGEVLLLAFDGGKWVTYNAKTKHVEVLGTTPSFFYVKDYKESLMLLDGYCGNYRIRS